MASPQKEDGYTSIANELSEVFARTYLTSQESKVLWVILRKTYGYKNKKEDKISFSQFEKSTGMERRNVAKALKKLIKRNIIFRKVNGQSISYGLQKDYELWDKPLSKQTTVKTDTTIVHTDNTPLSKQITKPLSKQTTTKQKQYLNKKERAKSFSEKVFSNNGYPKDVLMEFIEYWTESSENQRKMRFEREKVFDINRRLKTWMRNKKKWEGKKNDEAGLYDNY